MDPTESESEGRSGLEPPEISCVDSFNSGSEFGSETESEMESIPCDPDDLTYINDPVHGMLEIHPLCKAVINTPEFQRLRYIKQCGLSYFVYPGAVHTRFEHSLGVCYLALRVVRKLHQMQNALTNEEALCVQLAALCHDIGHGPFSHSWERFVSSVEGKNKDLFKHEQMSTEIFEHLVENNSLTDLFNKYGINEEYRQFIKDLILGEPTQYKTLIPKAYLFEIVANEPSGLDIDRYEYLLRDSYFFGIKLDTNFERYLTGIVIVRDKDGKEHIGFRDKLKSHILNVFKSRADMHHLAYQHRVCLRLETMLVDILRLADDHIEINVDTDSKSYKLSECHKNVKAMLQLTDHLLETILFSKDSKLLESKNLILRILKRDFYEEVFDANIVVDKTNKEFDKSLKELEEELSKKYTMQFRIRIKKLEFGKAGNGNDDPLKNVWFVNKKKQVYKVNSEERDLSFWLPRKSRCMKIYIFCDGKTTEEMKAYIQSRIKKELHIDNTSVSM